MAGLDREETMNKAARTAEQGASGAASGGRHSVPWPSLGQAVAVPVDRRLYPLEVIYGAAYTMTDRAFVLLMTGQGDVVQVQLRGREPLDDDGLRQLGGAFTDALLDQALRVSLDEGARKVRELIVARSHFLDGGGGAGALLDAAFDHGLDDDPLEIAVPWEDKYGDGSAGGR
jgi:His-Xaa-Ser system protein HxsD